MTKRIFRSICLAALTVLLAGVVLIMGALYTYFTQVQQAQLRNETTLAAQAVSHEGMAYFENLSIHNCRVTWIGADGAVLYDSQSDAASMENHLEREEIQQALQTGYGESIRYSTTLMERYFYCARLLSDGTVLRLSTEQSTVLTLVLGMGQSICLVILAALILSLVLASRLSRQIVKPLNELDLIEPLSNEGYDELSPLLRRIDSQQRQLRQQSDKLRRRQEEFDAVVGNMREGLVLLSGQGKILSMNQAAARLLDAQWFCKGDDFLTVSRSTEVREAVEKALTGRGGERLVKLQGGEYQLDVTPVSPGEGTVSGVVLLLVDVTEKRKAEALRREFTANVSHELKTPLQSIAGYAELLAGGMVQPQDAAPFAGKIYGEAQRMIRLVEDILRLSRLDDGGEDLCWEELDLSGIAARVVRDLMPAAELAGVALTCTGGKAVLRGIPRLMSGIVFNLCDNAIKYNRKGGNVTVTVADGREEAVLTVRDTGIGIPREHQNRIFERFYRVDKSHSKDVGGTGLGLSIVKHAARIQNAKIELHSMVGEGTTVTVRFPKTE